MTDRARRRAEQQAQIAAMPVGKRIAIVLTAVVTAFVTALLIALVLDDDVDLGFLVAMSLSIGAVFAFQYLWKPRKPG